MRRIVVPRIIGMFVFCLIIGTILLVGINFGFNKKSEVKELPRLTISLNDVNLEYIHENGKKIEYYDNKLSVVDGENIDQYNNITIKGRGNSTWGDIKKPYTIKFSKKENLFELGQSKKWMLIANNFDDSLLRNDVALFIAKLFEEEYVSSGRFVDLVFIDEENKEGKDLGLYYVLKSISLGKDAVDLRDQKGILVELDNAFCEQEDDWYMTDGGDCIVVKDSVNEDYEEEAINSFLEQYDEIEMLAKAGEYEEIDKLADLESFAKYYLINDFALNRDAYVTSYYLYKDGDYDKIYAGPVWDFDVAFGNRNLKTEVIDDAFYSPQSDSLAKEYVFGWEYYDQDNKKVTIDPDKLTSRLIYYLMEMEGFRDLVRDVYERYLFGKGDIVMEYIEKMNDEIRTSALTDAQMWEKNDYDDAVEYLKWWIECRLDYFEKKYGNVINIERSVNEY